MFSPFCLGAEKKQLVFELIAAKEETGKTFTEISKEIGLTNAYTAQLFYNQVGGCKHQLLCQARQQGLLARGTDAIAAPCSGTAQGWDRGQAAQGSARAHR